MQPLRMAMIGGGPGAFIGPVHRMAAELDGNIRLVAGAFSANAERSSEAGLAYGLNPERAYSDIGTLLTTESEREDGADFVAVVTPNHLHMAAAEAALEAGFHVISDKPATATLAEALRLRAAVARSGLCYGLTHTYTGYAMIRQAKALVAAGRIGKVRKVVVDYPQGWLSQPVEAQGSKQAEWRSDPARSGAGGCIADIGVHAFNIAEYVSGLAVKEICADLSSMVPGRRLDDDASLLLRFSNGAGGVLQVSQIAAGARNGLTLRIWGEAGGLLWSHENPDRLVWEHEGDGTRLLHAGGSGLYPSVLPACRLPAGHPEGFVEAFANIYQSFAHAVCGQRTCLDNELPGIHAAVRGMAFIETAIASSRERRWLVLEEIEA